MFRSWEAQKWIPVRTPKRQQETSLICSKRVADITNFVQ